MNSPFYAPAPGSRSATADAKSRSTAPGAEPAGRLAARLVSDERSELRRELIALCAARGLRPAVAAVSIADLGSSLSRWAHTSHPTWSYLLRSGAKMRAPNRVATRPKFLLRGAR
jgi:hypothetical protein